jgi:hypothetical protein
MQSSGWVAASVVATILAAASPAHADDRDERGTPFDQGRVGVMLHVGEQSAFGFNHIGLGVGAGYFVLDGLELSAFALHEFGDGPSINEVSPSLRYVAQPLVGRWPVIPYAAVFYNHWFLGDGFSDLDTVGTRAGLLHMSGRLIVGLGVAFEHTVSTCTECNFVYPDVTFGFAF